MANVGCCYEATEDWTAFPCFSSWLTWKTQNNLRWRSQSRWTKSVHLEDYPKSKCLNETFKGTFSVHPEAPSFLSSWEERSAVVRTQLCWQSWEINMAEELWKRGWSHVLFLGREVLSKTISETCSYLCTTSKFQQNCYALNNGRFRLCQNAAGQICYFPYGKQLFKQVI